MTFLGNVFVALLVLSFICFSVSLFCWAHNEKYSFRMIIDADKSIYMSSKRIDWFASVTNHPCRT